jgi:hypothetical protein
MTLISGDMIKKINVTTVDPVNIGHCCGLLFVLSDPAWVRAQGPGVDLGQTPNNQTVLSGATAVFTLRVTNTRRQSNQFNY